MAAGSAAPPPKAAVKRAISAQIQTRNVTGSKSTATSKGNPLPSLLSLPKELLAKIITNMDLPTALSVAVVHPSLVTHAETRIWRSVRAALPDHWRRVSTCRPEWRNGEGYAAATEEEARIGEEWYRKNLREKIKMILLHGNARRMGLVRKLVLAPREGVIPEMIFLLEYVAPHLQVLELEGLAQAGHSRSDSPFWMPPDVGMLDHRIIRANISFPSLTHVRMRDSPLRASSFLQTLVTSAVNLIHLDIDLEDTTWRYRDDETAPVPPPFHTQTGLRFLRVKYNGDRNKEEPAGPLIPILRHSPELRQVALDSAEDGSLGIMDALCKLEHLQDLNWMIRPDEFCLLLEQARFGAGTAFPNLRRLLLNKGDDTEIFPPIPNIPTLEVYDIFSYFWEPDRSATTKPNPVTSPLPILVQSARACPHLCRVRYLTHCETDESGETVESSSSGDYLQVVDFSDPGRQALSNRVIGQFTSLRHGEEELIFIRFLIWMYEISDTPCKPNRKSRDKKLRYTAQDGSNRVKRYEYYEDETGCPFLHWQDMSEYDGVVVPREVIAEMRAVQGASEEEWTGRGIEVGDAAWKVLTDWRASQRAGAGASDVGRER